MGFAMVPSRFRNVDGLFRKNPQTESWHASSDETADLVFHLGVPRVGVSLQTIVTRWQILEQAPDPEHMQQAKKRPRANDQNYVGLECWNIYEEGMCCPGSS